MSIFPIVRSSSIANASNLQNGNKKDTPIELPDDLIIMNVFTYFPSKELCQLRNVCKEWRFFIFIDPRLTLKVEMARRRVEENRIEQAKRELEPAQLTWSIH